MSTIILYISFSIVITCLLFGIIYLIYKVQYYFYFGNISYFNYTINEKSYDVIKDHENYGDAAEILYKIDNTLLDLINKITKKYHKNDSNISPIKYKIIKNIIYKLQKNYKSHSIKENFPSSPGKDVSFNVNKGEHISLCLRDFKNPKNFHEFNDIIFVAIHELAHSTAVSYQHTDEFWYNFRILLEHAIEFNLYKFRNYITDPVNYCSMEITYTQLIDKNYLDENYFKTLSK